VSEAPAQEPATPEKGVADILKEAYELYRKHASALILTCAVVFVPASIVKSCAVSIITAPAVAAREAAEDLRRLGREDLDEAQRHLQDGYQRNADPATIARLKRDVDRVNGEMGRQAATAMGSFMVMILSILGTLVEAFIVSGLVVPLVIAGLAIIVADRLLGGQAGWREVWPLLSRRFTPWLTAAIPAALVIAFGYIFFYIPGVVLGLLFTFLSPVVLFEGLRGQAALQRSAQLVASDWLRIALMFIVLAVLSWFAGWVAHLLVPRSAIFLGSLLGDLATIVLLPLPAIGLVLLYLDIRRKRDGYTNERLRADLDALKVGS
jgi:hypothetical protein